MLIDRSISATSVAAWALWIIGGVVVLTDVFVGPPIMGVGLWTTGAAMVLSIRRMLCRQADRQREAFEMGRDFERGSELHSVR